MTEDNFYFKDGKLVSSETLKPENTGVCKHIDCGWCYQSALKLYNGCSGFVNCKYFKRR